MSYSHEYYLKNREKFSEANKKYIAKKRTENDKKFLSERNEYQKQYYKDHPNKRKAKNEYDKEWRKNHPDYFKNYKKRKQEEKEGGKNEN